MSRCEECNGSGSTYGTHCPTCGQRQYEDGVCPACGGSGERPTTEENSHGRMGVCHE